jgi:putative transposase
MLLPSKARIWYPGANYHIMCRGNHRHDIYRDDEDRQVYLTLLRETKKECSGKVSHPVNFS